MHRQIRSLWSNRGFSVAFILTLGLGIGANTAIFSVVNGVLLLPLPYPDADRILHLKQPARLAGRENVNFSFVEIADYREASKTVDQFVEFGDWTFHVLGRGEPHRATGGLVTSNFFQVLGLTPLLGRTLSPEEDGRAAAPAVVLTYDYWRRVFGSDPNVVGQALDLTSKQATILGVLRPASHYASERKQDFYANYACSDHYLSAAMQDERTHRMTDVFARLAPGATLDAARSELHSIKERLHQRHPDAYPANRGYDLEVEYWREELTRRARPTLLALMATTGLVLVLACANVGNLTLTRLLQRERELALRAALGATPGKIRRLLLGENLALSLAGAVLGLALAAGGLELLVAYASRFTLRTGEIGLDGWALAFTLTVAVAAAMLFAWLPRLPFSKDLGVSLAAAAGNRATGSAGRRRAQKWLVVAQLAISVILLFGSGLLVRSLMKLYGVEPGFDLENVLSLESPHYTRGTQDERGAFSASMLADLAAHPEIQTAAVASSAPLTESFSIRREFEVEGGALEASEVPVSIFQAVSEDYFRTIGTPILAGRPFAAADRADSQPVVILSRTLAKRFFPDRDPVGLGIRWKEGDDQWSKWATVVGVAADNRSEGLDQPPPDVVYRPATQYYIPSTVLVRSDRDAGRLAAEVVEKIRALDPNRAIDHVLTLGELRSENLAPQRLNAILFSLFAALALAVAGVGVFSVVGFSVAQRTREIGVRQAVGAPPGRIFRMVLGEALGLTAGGVLLGGLAALGLSRFLSGLLFEIEPFDPATLLAVTLALFGLAAAAALGPALRAARVDPMETLRAE